MAKSHWQSWRVGQLSAIAVAVAMSWSTRAVADDLAVPDDTSTLEQANAEPPAMYRLPAVDEQEPSDDPSSTDDASANNTVAVDEAAEVTPVDEPEEETWQPKITKLPPVVGRVAPAPTLLPPVDPPHAAPVVAKQTDEPPPETNEALESDWKAGLDPQPAEVSVAAAQSSERSSVGAVPGLMAYAPTTADLSRQLLPLVRKGYGLAQHGAVYAAQAEFIRVLRRIAEAKDGAENVDTHAQALAAGLRALDEADDFSPRGAGLEADLNVPVIVSAHRTPVLQNADVASMRPAEAIALYHQYARQELAQAAAGEQASSMALYGLGKVHNRLAREADGQLQHERKALVMFLAALDAGPGNHLAANEIGVLLSRGGQPAAASQMFRYAIDLAPTSTSYHNLAVTDRAQGYLAQAAANEQYASQLAERECAAGAASRAKGVEWVPPQELSRVAQPMPIEANDRLTSSPQLAPQPVGAIETAAKWPQKLIPGIFRR